MKLEEYLSAQGVEGTLSERLLPFFSTREYESGDIIQDVSENGSKVCLILKGIVRGFYLDADGNDTTKCFSREGEWCCFYNFLRDEPPPFYVQALEKCVLAEVSTAAFRAALDENAKLRGLFEKLYRDAFIKVEEKSSAFQRMTAKERYLAFLAESPDIAGRVKQELVASYLGITPSSLSRIKKEL